MSKAWDPDTLVGTRLGSCVLEAPLGIGGMGAVYLARQQRPHRQVAVKVLRPQLATDPKAWQVFLARFRREADATATLDHANIMPIYEFGEENGMAFLVMPYLADGSLATMLARQGPLPVLRVLEYIEQAASALDHAHSRGLVHRDVKPSNLLLHPDGRVLLADFGIARPFAGDPLATMDELGDERTGAAFEDVALTQTGSAMGTPEYMAPEQVQGEPVGPATDTYALGIVTYILLAGRTPFGGGELREVLSRQMIEPPQPLRFLRPDVPPRMEETIFWALAKEPEDRPASAGAFAHALRDSRRSRTLGQLWGWTSTEESGGHPAAMSAPAGPFKLGRTPGPTRSLPFSGGMRRAIRPVPAESGQLLSAHSAAGIEQAPSGATDSAARLPAFVPDDATLHDAAPAWRQQAPVWPLPARPAPPPGGWLPRAALIATAALVLAALVFGIGLGLGNILYGTGGGLFSSGGAGTPRPAVVSPTVSPSPSPTATVLANWLSVSPTSITLGCSKNNHSKTVKLTNNGPDTLEWTATIPSNFGLPEVSVSPSSGGLESGHTTSITITNRTFLGSHQDSVSFQSADSEGGAPAVVQFDASCGG